jgi:alpha,alpha-trehalose-phosphate synthase [UDP-forming]
VSAQAPLRAPAREESHPANLPSRAGRLLLASNREPFQPADGTPDGGKWVPSMGGLASGLMPLLRQHEGVWVCWNPQPQQEVDESGERVDNGPFPLLQVALRPAEVRDYYNGFCNRVLWPLCHDIMKRVSPRLDYWQQFRTVNERFAGAIAGAADPDDLVWLHDYHLMLVPEAMRQRLGRNQRIGYFHHIPFPEPRALEALPWHRQLLSGLLGADAVAFHTAGYAVRFIECCGNLLDCDIDSEPGMVIHGGHRTLVRARPIGIDSGSFARLAEDPEIVLRAIELRRRFTCDCLMLSVDRLDYTKGLVERVEAIHELFSRVPQCRGIVTFVQIAVPTRPEIPDYQQYRAHFESAVGIVNETFGTDEWQPIVCRTEPLSRQELVAYYLAADVACVTPVADGMNLVALEYCASRTGNDGVLVLSRQAGASALLGESAVTVDARRTESIVGGLVQALTMPGTERARRMTELRSVVMRSSSEQWLRRCLADIEPAAANLPPGRTVN